MGTQGHIPHATPCCTMCPSTSLPGTACLGSPPHLKLPSFPATLHLSGIILSPITMGCATLHHPTPWAEGEVAQRTWRFHSQSSEGSRRQVGAPGLTGCSKMLSLDVTLRNTASDFFLFPTHVAAGNQHIRSSGQFLYANTICHQGIMIHIERPVLGCSLMPFSDFDVFQYFPYVGDRCMTLSAVV